MAIGGSTLPEQDGSWNESSLLTSCEMFVNGTWYNSSNLTHPRANFQVSLHRLLTFLETLSVTYITQRLVLCTNSTAR